MKCTIAKSKIYLRMIFLFLVFFLSQTSLNGGKVAVILHGETFRINSKQLGREVGAAGIHDQHRASKSHIQYLISPLEFLMGYSKVDFFMESYKNDFSGDMLYNWYSAFAPKDHFNITEKYYTVTEGVLKTLMTKDYDAIFISRPDIILKSKFPCYLNNANRNKTLFSSKAWLEWDTIIANGVAFDRIADFMIWIPKWAFPKLVNYPLRFICDHDAFKNIAPFIGRDNIGYILPGQQHDSDPAVDRNPIYSLAGRNEHPQEVQSVVRDVVEICKNISFSN